MTLYTVTSDTSKGASTLSLALAETDRFLTHVLKVIAAPGGTDRLLCTAVYTFQLTSALMARVEFGKDAGEYGILGSVLAIGSLSGALWTARRKRPRMRVIVAATLGFGIALAVLAGMGSYTTLAWCPIR